MSLLKAPYKILAIAGIIVLADGCTVEKNTATTRFYHGMTARYNIYFNGYESFKAGVIKVNNGYRDDYAEILRVFEFSDPSSPGLCGSDMERAIQKASKLISLKSITAKPDIKKTNRGQPAETDLLERKEYNEWVDDSYLLIGKARFYKQEFNEATSVLSYSVNQANDPDIRNEASIWLARVYNETARYPESLRILSELEITENSQEILRSMYYSTLADLFIKQKKYSEAIIPLEKAVDLASGKRQRYRLTYLLAQLNEQAGKSAAAIDLYRKVVRMNPPYDVEFNARINIAGVFDVGAGDPKVIRKELDRMLRDVKNQDFLDQIFYARGNLSMKEGNITEALESWKRSVSASTTNQNQKGRSYLALANYFYNIPDFLKAGLYFDSTVFFLDKKHPDYQAIKTRSTDLNSVVSQLRIIQQEDSLQRVAAMPEQERNNLISGIINKIIKDESEGKTSEFASRYSLGQYYENERRYQGNIEQEGKWYFYNQSALTFGRSEFRRRWGDRPLEDNWRRINKAIVTVSQQTGEGDDKGMAGGDSASTELDYKKPEFYLRNLPLTDSLKTASNEKIANAYLAAGKAYSEKLGDKQRANESFEKLLERFPGNELVPETLYNLYRVNKDFNNARGESYRQRLLEKHPDTEFAKILSDPAYYEKKFAEMKMAEQTYEKAYSLYLNEDFTSVVSICDESLQNYPKDQLAPKFMLLRAYSVARLSDERNFKEELEKVTKSWPETEESKKAAEIIAYLNQENPELKIEEEKEIAGELYFADTVSVHIFAVVIGNPQANLNQAAFDIISYNIDNYTNNNYRTLGELLDNKNVIITVSGFRKYREALNYYNLFDIAGIVRNPSGYNIYKFIISESSLKTLRNDKNPDRYYLFFKEQYLKEIINP